MAALNAELGKALRCAAAKRTAARAGLVTPVVQSLGESEATVVPLGVPQKGEMLVARHKPTESPVNVREAPIVRRRDSASNSAASRWC
jgi:hypothetical protein